MRRGTASEAATRWAEEVTPRGEFTIVVAPAEQRPVELDAALVAVEVEMRSGSSMSDAVRVVAESLGLARRPLYEAVLARQTAEG